MDSCELSDEMLRRILEQKNKYARLNNLKQQLKELTLPKLKSFFGIVIYLGICKLPLYRFIWNEINFWSVPKLACVLSRNEFESISLKSSPNHYEKER
jgi:hypothetical protein